MSPKSLIQLTIILLIILISATVYLNYFTKDTKDLTIKIKASNAENIEDKGANYLENINYVSEISENIRQVINIKWKLIIGK